MDFSVFSRDSGAGGPGKGRILLQNLHSGSVPRQDNHNHAGDPVVSEGIVDGGGHHDVDTHELAVVHVDILVVDAESRIDFGNHLVLGSHNLAVPLEIPGVDVVVLVDVEDPLVFDNHRLVDMGEILVLNSPVDILDTPLVGAVALFEMFHLQDDEDRLY